MQSRKRPFAAAISLVVALVALLGGCQTTGSRPEGAQPASPPATAPEGQPIAASEAILNLALFFDPAAIIEVRRSGLEGILVDRFLLRDGSGDGEIVSLHIRGSSRWNDDVAFRSESAFREKADKILTDLREVRPIRRGETLTGYRAVGASRKTAASCVFANAGYDLIGNSGPEAVDTTVVVFFCGSRESDPARFDKMLVELDAIRDRDAYRAAMRSRQAGAALPQQRPTTLRLQNPIAGRWEGVAEEITGFLESSDDGTGGTVSFALPGNAGTCLGSFLYAPGRLSGRWSAACTNNLTASGNFESLGSNKGFKGTGQDSKGRAVTFLVGVAVQPPPASKV